MFGAIGAADHPGGGRVHDGPGAAGTSWASDRLPGAARVTFHAALNIFGANVVAAHSALELAFAVLHLAGAALAAWAACLAALRFFRARDLLVPAFAVAIAR